MVAAEQTAVTAKTGSVTVTPDDAMAKRRAQLTTFYAKHDASKTPDQVAGLLMNKFEDLCEALMNKYGDVPPEWRMSEADQKAASHPRAQARLDKLRDQKAAQREQRRGEAAAKAEPAPGAKTSQHNRCTSPRWRAAEEQLRRRQHTVVYKKKGPLCIDLRAHTHHLLPGEHPMGGGPVPQLNGPGGFAAWLEDRKARWRKRRRPKTHGASLHAFRRREDGTAAAAEAASAEGGVQLGDTLVVVNGVDVAQEPFWDVIQVLQGCAWPLELRFAAAEASLGVARELAGWRRHRWRGWCLPKALRRTDQRGRVHEQRTIAAPPLISRPPAPGVNDAVEETQAFGTTNPAVKKKVAVGVLHFLDNADLYNQSLVSKKWCTYALDPAIWYVVQAQPVHLRRALSNSPVPSSLLLWWTGTTRNLRWIAPRAALVDKTPRTHRGVRVPCMSPAGRGPTQRRRRRRPRASAITPTDSDNEDIPATPGGRPPRRSAASPP